MAQWYIKELAQLVGVSVRTLHHYDKIGLLPACTRLSNGYRVYTATHVLRLQQITALKFFGFSLQEIKRILCSDLAMLDHFHAQYKLVKNHIASLVSVEQSLEYILNHCQAGSEVNIHAVLHLMKRYTMSQDLKKTWAADIYTEKELDTFAQLKQSYTDQEIENYQDAWVELITRVKENLHQDPTSAIAKDLALQWHNLLNRVYGNNPELKNTIYTAYKENKIPNPLFDSCVFEWIEKATYALKAI